MQLIGTRSNSSFRVDAQYFKDRPWLGLRDLHTNGPLAVVEDWTDNELPDYQLDRDPASPTYREIVHRPAPRGRGRAAAEE